MISFGVNLQGVSCGACGNSRAEILLIVDGSMVCIYNNATIANGSETTVTGTYLYQMYPGTHTVKAQLRWVSGPAVAAYGPNPYSYLAVILLPQ